MANATQSRGAPSRRMAMRRRIVAICTLAGIGAVAAFALLAAGGSDGGSRDGASGSSPAPAAKPAMPSGPPYAVALRTLRLVDSSRRIQLPDGSSAPRALLTYVRYPTAAAGHVPPAGPFPLIVFGHGFALSPRPYARLLDAWTRAGYVVAAPVFPLENADAPGGPDESDLVNQPADMSFVISSMLTRSAASTGPLRHLIDPTKIAATGQSDGGETALAVGYDPAYRDTRVGAVVILSGAKIPGSGALDFSSASPPLLATQGTADTINPPSFTLAFYDAARFPKFLLELPGAGHLGPYTGEQPQLGIVARVTVAFLDRYLKGKSRDLRRVGDVAGLSSLVGHG